MKHLLLLSIALFVLLPLCEGAIKIIQDGDSRRALGRVGSSVVLRCRTNQHWEYCTWKHVSRGTACNFEWKYSSGNVERTKCPSLWQKASFAGDYYKHECNINLTSVEERDFGQWTCIIEDYVLFGGRGAVVRGYVDLINEEEEVSTPSSSLSTTTQEDHRGLSWGDLATTEGPISTRGLLPRENKEVIKELSQEASNDGSTNAFLAVGIILGLMFSLFFLAIVILAYRRRRKSKLELQWLRNKKKNIPITEVVPDDAYDPEQNVLDINPSTHAVKYLESRKSSVIEAPELRLF